MTRAEVIRQIVARESKTNALLEATVREENAELYAEACAQFGTWETALQYAGVDVQQLASESDYSPPAVRREIRRLCRRPHPITATAVRRRHRRLYVAAIQHFGNWRQALVAASINPDNIRPYSQRDRPTRQQIIDILLERNEAGRSLRWIDICCENRALALEIKSTFLAWVTALEAAGLRPERVRKWNRQKVIEALQARHRQGLPLRRLCQHDSVLYAAARRRFGTLHEALSAAGLEAEDG